MVCIKISWMQEDLPSACWNLPVFMNQSTNSKPKKSKAKNMCASKARKSWKCEQKTDMCYAQDCV
jgi:hypothetical protein